MTISPRDAAVGRLARGGAPAPLVEALMSASTTPTGVVTIGEPQMRLFLSPNGIIKTIIARKGDNDLVDIIVRHLRGKKSPEIRWMQGV